MKLARVLPALIVAPLLLAATATAHAQVIGEAPPPPFPDAKKFARGFFGGGEAGALVFVGPSGRYLSPGPMLGVQLGYDLFRFLAVQAHVAGASFDATLPAPRLGQSVQTYLYLAEARLSLQIRRVGLSLRGGGGVAQLSSNVLDLVGVTRGTLVSPAVTGGAGIDYHTLNRHFSLGLEGAYLWLATWSGTHAVTATAYLRYTR